MKWLLLGIMFLGSTRLAVGQQKTLSDVQLKDVAGNTHRLNEYKGKVVLLNFWGTWCPPCMAEMPDLVRYQREYKNKGIQFVGITHTSPIRNVRQTMKRFGVNYPVLIGTSKIFGDFDISDVLPVTIVVDHNGIVRDRIEGFMTPEEFDQKVKPLLQADRK